MPDLPTDAFLVLKTRRGDAAAYETLVRRYYRKAYVVAYGQIGNQMDAEDVCQDAFLRALERLDDCRQPERFAGWLLQIVRNRAHNFRDYQRVRSAESLDRVTLPTGQPPPDHAVRAELRGHLEEALNGLSEIRREVVLLHDLEGWTHREIAESLNISEGMSRQHLFAARKILRERLGSGALKEYCNE